MNQIITGLIQLVFLLFLLLGVVIIGRKIKKGKSISMPKTNNIARIVETVIIFSLGLVFFISLSCFNDGMLLLLDKLRPAFAKTHIIVAVITLAFLFLTVLLAWFGKTSIAVIVMTIILVSYSVVIKKAPFEGPGYIMTKIAPKDSWIPKVNYTFEVGNGLEGAEVWINGFLLGKTPLKITGDEFNQKVPFLTEPPDGDWFKISLTYLGERDSKQGRSYLTEFKDYYAKIKYEDEWCTTCTSGSSGRGGSYEHNYNVSISGNSSIIDKIEHKRKEGFNKLIQKARLADYKIDDAWMEALATYGDRVGSDIQNLTKNEKQFSNILNEYVKWKDGISDTMTEQEANKLFDDICRQVDEQDYYSNGGFESRAVNMIYNKLNIEKLIKKYEKLIKARNAGNSSLSDIIVFQALKLWDAKLNKENSGVPNIIEKKLVPILIVNNAVDSAIPFGGPDIDRFLIRQYQRNPKIEGIELGAENYTSTMGMQINKWLYNLALEASPAAEKFREKNRREILKLAKLMTNTDFNHEKKPPEFLFYDINLGKQSMAYEFWPEYSVLVESSFPPWWNEKLKKRLQYLNRLGSLATEDMYLQCWNTTKKLDDFTGGSNIVAAIETIALNKRIPVAKEIIKDIEKYLDAKRAELKTEQERYLGFPQDRYLGEIKKSLAKIGDEESIQWWLSELVKSGPNNNEPQRFREMLEYEDVPANHPMIKALAQNENPDLRILSLDAIHKFPISANREILEKLLNDSNEEVRSAAKQVAAELEEIKNTPIHELISESKSNERNI